MTSCCNSSCGCSSATAVNALPHKLLVEFLYLDLSQCGWCQGTEKNFDSALGKLLPVLETMNIQVTVNKIHVDTEDKARELGFVTSPTIRVNGKDVQLQFKEAKCTACSDLCGEDVECRVWLYQGQEYTSPPEGLIIQAILQELFSASPTSQPKVQDVPVNLKKFFAGDKLINNK